MQEFNEVTVLVLASAGLFLYWLDTKIRAIKVVGSADGCCCRRRGEKR